MSKRCPDCGFLNEDSRIYCGSCGELLDAELRLIQNLEKQKSTPSKTQSAKAESAPAKTASKRSDDDDDDYYVPRKRVEEKKSSPAPWIILGVIVVAVIIWVVTH